MLLIRTYQGGRVHGHYDLRSRLTGGFLTIESIHIEPEKHARVDHGIPIRRTHVAQATLKRIRRHRTLISNLHPIGEFSVCQPLAPLQSNSIRLGKLCGFYQPAGGQQSMALDRRPVRGFRQMVNSVRQLHEDFARPASRA